MLTNPWTYALLGGIISGIAVILLVYILKRCWAYIKIKKTIQLSTGIKIPSHRGRIIIKQGTIEDEPTYNRNAAVILPAHTTFKDECIRDSRSALGAFFNKYFPDDIEKIEQVIQDTLIESGCQTNNGEYPPGTTILLPPPYNKPVSILITASTTKKEKIGIDAEPGNICRGIHEALKITSDRKIHKIYLPLLGTGHGGLNKYSALIFLLLTLKHYSYKFHHVKEFSIIIHPKDMGELNEIYRIQYLKLLTSQTFGEL